MTTETFPKPNGYGIAITFGAFNQRIESPRTYRTLYGARMAVEDWAEMMRNREPVVLFSMPSPMPDLAPIYEWARRQIDRSILGLPADVLYGNYSESNYSRGLK